MVEVGPGWRCEGRLAVRAGGGGGGPGTRLEICTETEGQNDQTCQDDSVVGSFSSFLQDS